MCVMFVDGRKSDALKNKKNIYVKVFLIKKNSSMKLRFVEKIKENSLSKK